MSSWQSDQVWKNYIDGVLLNYVLQCSNLKQWDGPRDTLGQSTAYMAMYSDFR